MLSLLFRIVQFIVQSVYAYAASDQGRSELVSILNLAEADGVDVPFYQPPTSGNGSPMSESVDGAVSSSDDSGQYVSPTSPRKDYPKEG